MIVGKIDIGLWLCRGCERWCQCQSTIPKGGDPMEYTPINCLYEDKKVEWREL